MKDKFTSHKSTASVSIYIVMEINLEGIGDMIKKRVRGNTGAVQESVTQGTGIKMSLWFARINLCLNLNRKEPNISHPQK